MISCETVPIEILDGHEFEGPYKLVAHSLRGEPEQTWWAGGDSIIKVEPERVGYPYEVIVSDFDGTVVRSEGEGHFFYERRNALMREAGIHEDHSVLNKFQTDIWKWDRDIYQSAAGMIKRIDEGRDIHGNQLKPHETVQLKKLLERDVLRAWAEKAAPGKYPDQQFKEFASIIIAERLEQIGMEILEAKPERVLTLAPFFPGVVDFFRSIPTHTPLAMASGSFRESTIVPILNAHAAMGNNFVCNRIGNLIAGAEDVRNAKPDPFFYIEAQIAIVKKMRMEGRFPPGGIMVKNFLFLGDTVSGQCVDASRKRLHSVLVVNVGDIVSPGPLTAVVPDFPTLLVALEEANKNSPHVIQRLSRTLQS
ncbi:hypothetical protein HY947_01905 [Candidatus Gottesmanbacteria bacterium]|nr:hypothetical protein [Candidatus Gottesmanbacteria bacterium]